jgi:carboxyl-terminal processing protease
LNYNAEGRPEPVADSLIQEFKTKGGRKVYDGGGIMPDKKMESEYLSRFTAILVYTGIVEDFGDVYFKKNHGKQIDIKNFSISDEDYADFIKLAMEHDIPYKSESRTALEKLRAALVKERNTSLDEALNAIDKGLKDDKRSNLETFREEIIEQINRNIILRYAYSRGVIENSLSKDKEIQEAVKLLANKEEYQRIITKQDTARK